MDRRSGKKSIDPGIQGWDVVLVIAYYTAELQMEQFENACTV
jgi:hypothetical protein